MHKKVLTVAYEKQSESNAMWALSVPIPFNMPVHAGAGGYFAPHVRSYIRRSGAPTHIGAIVAAKDRQNALKNPFAHLRNPDTTVESVLASQMLWDPIRYDETCPSSDGACALVIVAEDEAARSRNPAWIHGTVMRSEATTAAERDQVNPQASRDAAAALWKQAGITNPIEEIDEAEIYVPFSWFEPMWLESLGFARRGRAAGSSPSPAPPRWTASSRSTARAACSRRTRSAPPGCSASARPPSRSAARPASTRSTAPARRWATRTAAARSSSRCGSSARRSPATDPGNRSGASSVGSGMAELIRTNDLALIAVVEGLLLEAEIPVHIADRHTSALEGGMNWLQMRVLGARDEAESAARGADQPTPTSASGCGPEGQ